METVATDEQAQRAEWVQMRKHFTDVLDNMHNVDVLETYKRLFQENMLLGQKLFIGLLLKGQYDAQLSALLVSLVSVDIPSVGHTLTQEATLRFIQNFGRRNYNVCFWLVELLSQLFNYDVIHEIIVLQLLQLLSEETEQTQNDDKLNASVNLMTHLLMTCGKKLLSVSRTMHNSVLDTLRQLLQTSSRLSGNVKQSVDRLMDARQREYVDVIAQKLLERPFETASGSDDDEAYMFIIDEEFTQQEPDVRMDAFRMRDDMSQLAKQYKGLRFHVLERVHAVEEQRKAANTVLTVHNMTDSEEIAFKKQIYLTLKSSLSGEEATHKLLKMRIPDRDKLQAVEMLERSMVQESTYSKFYGSIAENLLPQHRSWSAAFRDAFSNRLGQLEDLEPSGIRNSGKFWGHLFATGLFSSEVLEQIHITEEGSTPPLRIFVKFMFQQLVFELGIEQLQSWLAEPDVAKGTANMFPVEEVDDTRYSINYFTAIGLGVLTEGMRRHLEVAEESEEELSEDEVAGVDPEEETANDMAPGHDSKEELSNDRPSQSELAVEKEIQAGRDNSSRYEGSSSRYEGSSSRYDPSPKRRRSITPPRRDTRRRSVTPPRRRR